MNTGSSSLKASLYQVGPGGADRGPEFCAGLALTRIGLPQGEMRAIDAEHRTIENRPVALADHARALDALLAWLQRTGMPSSVGHRVVHGGSAYSAPRVVDDALLDALHALVPVDPEHLPQAIGAIERLQRDLPGVPQIACFDTAFHRTMPRIAQIYALPKQYIGKDVTRYGFHGLSYEYIVDRLRQIDPTAAGGRVIAAHLGNGASMTAIRDGRSVETTMGFSPTGGLVMGSRPGDLDPGVLLYLLREGGLDLRDAGRVLNAESGLRAVSGSSGDMQDLLAREATDPCAAEAVELFCYTARKSLGALATVLGGLDTLVFTGGIGEHAAPVREHICAGLDFLGIHIDPDRNRAHDPLISPDGSAVAVRVIPTDEDLMIARHVKETV